MKPKLSARLDIKARHLSHEPVRATFELTNKSSSDVYILSWETPIEGLFSDCLEIVRDGEPVPYDGPLVKRGVPTKEQYIRVRAGETIKKEVDLSSAYQVSRPGEYLVKVKCSIRHLGTQTELKKLTSSRVLALDHRPAQLRVRSRKFRVYTGKHFRATQGEAARRLEDSEE